VSDSFWTKTQGPRWLTRIRTASVRDLVWSSGVALLQVNVRMHSSTLSVDLSLIFLSRAGWQKRNENFELYVTHNGDLDYLEELDTHVLRTHKEVGLWLQLVLRTPRSEIGK
jgi:hypothetical protein